MPHRFLNFTNLKATLALSAPVNGFLGQLKANLENESQFMTNIARQKELAFIINGSENSEFFEFLCQKECYHSLWSARFSQLGRLLSAFKENPVSFFPPPKTVSSFDLLRGAFFFHKSQLVRKELQKVPFANDFSHEELRFIQHAMNYNSIHATQRYNQYLYTRIARAMFRDEVEGRALLTGAIEHCNELLECHGSYAYMMLVDAYFHYAKFVKADSELAERAIQSALKACDYAKKFLETSKFSIHNASFGEGLGFSNSLNIADPDEAKILLARWNEFNKASQSGSPDASLLQKKPATIF